RAVVRGGEDYRVDLRFDGSWETDCSCPVGVDCKHGVAALLKLQEQAEGNGVPARHNSAATGPLACHKPDSNHTPREPASPLHDKLIEKLGRKLNRAETSFIRRVQSCWNRARNGCLTEGDLMTMTGFRIVPPPHRYWEEVSLWPDLPRDDFYFWLHVAWELRRRNIDWPPFIDEITDLCLIEPAIRNWEQAKEVEQWQNWFTAANVAMPQAPADPGILELRLAIFTAEARLQWRTNSTMNFSDFKQTHAKKFGTSFDNGSLSIAVDSLPLWSAAYKPWSYNSWWSFRYNDSTALPALGRLLKLPLSPDRVVTPDGKPFPRDNPPLRLTLDPPANGSGNYRLALTTAEGGAPPPILCILHGHPTRYLTPEGTFPGPSHLALDAQLQNHIPADAIETTEGLRFLQANGVALPEHLQDRVSTVF